MIKLSDKLSTGIKLTAIAAAVVIASGCAGAKTQPGEVAEPAAPVIMKKEETLSATELFAFDSAVLSAGGMAALDDLFARSAGAAEIGNITVEGHTDPIGSDAYNMGLSEHRAQAVVDYMIGKGVPAGAISAIGKGETELVVQCDQGTFAERKECNAPNRRVDVVYPILVEEEVMMEQPAE